MSCRDGLATGAAGGAEKTKYPQSRRSKEWVPDTGRVAAVWLQLCGYNTTIVWRAEQKN